MRSIALALFLLLTPGLARAGDKLTFPLHCGGSLGEGRGQAQINAKGDALGSVKFPVAAQTELAFMCELSCDGDTYAPVSCGLMKAGHKSFKFKATGLLLA